MTAPSFFGWLLLVWLLVILPRGAMRTARLFRQASASPDHPLPSRSALFLGTLYVLGTTLLIAWVVAADYGWGLFESPPLSGPMVGAGAVAMLLMLALRQASLLIRTPAERREMPVRRLLPRSSREWVLYGMTSIVAGVAEEAAYRGAIMSVLIGLLGVSWAAVLISAVAFALGHALQGWKSMVVIFGMALVMHGLVFVTGTLVVAMAVHAGYDLLAGVLGAGEEREAAGG